MIKVLALRLLKVVESRNISPRVSAVATPNKTCWRCAVVHRLSQGLSHFFSLLFPFLTYEDPQDWLEDQSGPWHTASVERQVSDTDTPTFYNGPELDRC